MTKIKDLVKKYGNREIDEVELEKLLKPVKVKTIYTLEFGDTYYLIDEVGRICECEWTGRPYDTFRLTLGNVYLTQEDAEFALEKLKITAELKRYASMCKEPVDWEKGKQRNWFLTYSYYFKKLELLCTYDMTTDSIYFTDKPILDQAIREIGEERIKKYYFGIKGGK